jgi:hypothetical protein
MSDEPVVVFRSQGPLEAEVALSKLGAEGILAYLRYEAIGRTLGLTVNGLGLVQVLVSPVDAERASEILEASTDGLADVDSEAQEWDDDDPVEEGES